MNEQDYRALHDALKPLSEKVDKVLDKVGALSTDVALAKAAHESHARRIELLEQAPKPSGSTTSDLDRELKRKQIRFYAVLIPLVTAVTGLIGVWAYHAGAATIEPPGQSATLE